MTATTWNRRPQLWMMLALILGLALRAWYYFSNPSVWHDEAVLLINVLGKNFSELLGHLDFHEAAPPLFLWAERAAAQLLGDATYSLRLLPFLASCATLLLTAWVAWRCLPPVVAPWAVMLVACSERLLWHTCEAKPYAIDALAAVSVLALYLKLQTSPIALRCLAFAALAPLIIWLTFPGCFLYGAVLVALLPEVWHERARRPAAWLSYGTLVVLVAVSFLLLYSGPIRAQRHAHMDACWLTYFPDWSRPGRVPVWIISSTANVMQYCLSRHVGFLFLPLALAGSVVLYRRHERALLVLLTLPLVLALLASCLHAYPYGGARVVVFAAPGLAVLAGLGVLPIGTWLWARSRVVTVLLALVLLEPLPGVMFRLAFPWTRTDSDRAAEFVLRQLQPGDLVVGNHWEHFYYFRGLQTEFRPMDRYQDEGRKRVWLVVTAPTREDQQTLIEGLPGAWRPSLRREFTLTTVCLFER